MEARRVTFNMPVSLHQQLRVLIGNKRMSQFVCTAVRERLAEEKRKLQLAYRAAEKERTRRETLNEWQITEAEGWE